MIAMMKKILKDSRIYINKKIESCKWSFSTIAITLTTGKTLTATDKTLTGVEKKKIQ